MVATDVAARAVTRGNTGNDRWCRASNDDTRCVTRAKPKNPQASRLPQEKRLVDRAERNVSKKTDPRWPCPQALWVKPGTINPRASWEQKAPRGCTCLPHTVRGREAERLMRFSQNLHVYRSTEIDAGRREVSVFFRHDASKSRTNP